MSQLVRIRLMRKDDPLFHEILGNIDAKLHKYGIEWLEGAWKLSTLDHAVAKVGLQPQDNLCATQVMKFIAGDLQLCIVVW